MKKFVSILVIVLFLFTTGCATILKGTSQTVSFNSEPAGATVLVDGKAMGVTPVALMLKKNKYDTVTVQKKGYKSQTMPIKTRFDGIAIINIFWDLSTTDLITGAIVEYKPDNYHFELKKLEGK
jgi:uncharacterized protein YceK